MNAFSRTLAAGFVFFCTLVAAVPAHAQTVSPVPAPTIITTAPYTITKAGYYQLGKDLTISATSGSIITIKASNVTLDFAGHYISGPVNSATQLYGVSAYEQGNIVIRNGTVAYCYVGIHFDGSGESGSLNINQRVDNMLLTYCYYSGLLIEYASNSEVTNCHISFIIPPANADASGIFAFEGTGLEARNNIITSITASGSGKAFGILGNSVMSAINNSVSNVTTGGSGSAYGIYQSPLAISNRISNCQVGISCLSTQKYQGNVTTGCATPFSGGTAAGYENN